MTEKLPGQIDEDLLPEGKREELESEFGDVVAIEIKGSVFAFRGPKRPEYKRHRQMCQRKNADIAEHNEELLMMCCVYPEKEALVKHFDRWPMAATSAFVAFSSAMGMDYETLSIVK